MNRKKNGCFCAVLPLAIVACVSLAIVGGIVTWVSAREGTGPGDLAAEMLQRQQPARPILPQYTPQPTLTLRPSPTPIPVAIASELHERQVGDEIVVGHDSARDYPGRGDRG